MIHDFIYLGSVIFSDVRRDREIRNWLTKASSITQNMFAAIKKHHRRQKKQFTNSSYWSMFHMILSPELYSSTFLVWCVCSIYESPSQIFVHETKPYYYYDFFFSILNVFVHSVSKHHLNQCFNCLLWCKQKC